MALRGRRINNFVEFWCLVASGGLDIWVSSTSFQKSNIGWPQQPPKERVPDISKKLDFWWSIPQKGTGLEHLGARDDLTISISIFFGEMRLLRSLRLQRFYGLSPREETGGLQVANTSKYATQSLRSKSLHETQNPALADCRVILVPEFSFILMFWEQFFFVRIMEYQVEFWHLLS